MIGNKAVLNCLEKNITATGTVQNNDLSSLKITFDQPIQDIPFLYQDHILLKIFDPIKGEQIYQADVKSCFKDVIFLEDVALIETIQRRNEARVNFFYPTKVNKLQMPDQDEIELNKYLPIDVLNISAGGLLFFSKLKLPLQVILTVQLPIEGIEAKIQVVRITQNGEGFQYGCQFINLSDDDKTSIRKFVFQCQMEEKRKKLT